MLRDPLLQERYDEHLAKLELVELEVEHNINNGHVRYLAEHYATEFNSARELWNATRRLGNSIQAIPRQ